jgi:hypothetical protein
MPLRRSGTYGTLRARGPVRTQDRCLVSTADRLPDARAAPGRVALRRSWGRVAAVPGLVSTVVYCVGGTVLGTARVIPT